MSILDLTLLCGAGIIGGWLNVMAGGGSMLSIPALMFLGLPGPVANGTNRIAILAQNVAAVSTFIRRGFADWRLSLSLTGAAIPGAIVGASLGARLDGVWFDRVLAITMLVVLAWMLVPSRKRDPANEQAGQSVSRRRMIAGHFAMVGAGVWGGFIQIGVGFILMPILHRLIGLELSQVNQHKVVIVLGYTIVALAVFAQVASVDWRAGAVLAVGMAVGGWLGARTTLARGARTIRIVYAIAIVGLVVKLLFF